MKIKLCFLIVFACHFGTFSQDTESLWLHPNAGQWHENIIYKAELNMGEMYLEKNGFLFNLSNEKTVTHNLSHKDNDHSSEDTIGKIHAIRAEFLESSWANKQEFSGKSSFYRNYFLGEESKWRSQLYSYHVVNMLDFYPGIDLNYEGMNRGLKYSFIVKPGQNPNVIQTKYTGTQLYLDDDGNLHIPTSFGDIIEEKPIAWTIHNNRRKEIKIAFILENNIVSYALPNGYNTSDTLIIDPTLVFSSFTGAGSDNWGFTAAPDLATNVFGAGIVFGPNYPITAGAFDATYNNTGGFNSGVDVAITKFNANGNALIYSTFLGGSGNETPHSIVCSPNGELYIFGSTGSSNFPVTAGAYQSSHAGGTSISIDNIDFNNGTDIYITRMSANGTSLIGSTYLGGNQNDGNNSSCNYNYGDQFRGEIILDATSVYISSSTKSNNFPGATNSIAGNQDAIICKLPQSLTGLTYSRFFGGINDDSGNAIQLSPTGDLYIVGATKSAGLPFPLGEDLSFNGGTMDGYLARFSSSTGALLSGTYMGGAEFDQTYFVQLDLNNDVYVFGQSETSFPISAGKYGNPNSGQFIRKYNSALTNILWTTMIGAGTGHPEISPTAFLVSDCFDIYFSGWGGLVNSNNSAAVFSSSNGFPVTSDAYQSTTNGNNFYIAVLSQDAVSLKYATYFGSLTASYNHVDGGTSRFDKQGRIYHAVCGACGGNDYGFTTTPGAFSPTNNSSNCNMAVFKFELNKIETVVNEPTNVICIPDPVMFTSSSVNANTFFWNFGDNTTSNQQNPSHVYTSPGVYTVTHIVSDASNCFSADTVVFDVTIGEFAGGVVQPGTTVCPGGQFQLEAYGGTSYLWSPANLLDDPTSATPIATAFTTTTFSVIVTDVCGSDTLDVTLDVFAGISDISNDTSICIGNSVNLFVNGGDSYLWSPSTYLDDPTIATPVSTPTSTINYVVEITTSDGCAITDSVLIVVYFTPPNPQIPDLLNLCEGKSTTIIVSGADTYSWSPNSYIDTTMGSVVVVNPPNSMYYYCDFINACGVVPDSVYIQLRKADVEAFSDTIICPGVPAYLYATGVNKYLWSPASNISNPTNDSIKVYPDQPTFYIVKGTDQYGCIDFDTVYVDLFPQPSIIASNDVYAFLGDVVEISAVTSSTGNVIWSPQEFLSCVVCNYALANPNQNYTYVASYTDQNGCIASDEVKIIYDPIIYIPNTFTPNSDEFNGNFFAKGGNIKTFQMYIFNRWGELIFTMNSLNDSWDGTYEGNPCQDGTYTWKVRYTDFNDNPTELTGHINLLR